MPNNELQELLGARFKEHTHATNEAVWSAIEAQLDSEQKDRPGIWFWLMNGAAILVLCSAMIWNPSAVDSLTSTTVELEDMDQMLTSSEQSSDVSNENASLKSTENDGLLNTAKVNEVRKQLQWTGPNVTEATWEPNYMSETPIEFGFPVDPFPVFVNEKSKSEDPFIREENDNLVDHLSLLSLNNAKSNSIQRDPHLIVCGTYRNIFNNIPIHLGVEFTYLNRTGNPPSIPSTIDTLNTWMNDELAFNRHFEVNAFSQFDLTRRFSASVGVGYSNSFVRIDSDTMGGFNSFYITPEQDASVHLITIPVQANYHFIRKNRFAMSTGLTFQTEIGWMKHTVQTVDQTGSTVTTTEVSNNESTTNSMNLRQFAFEPNLQVSYNFTPRLSAYSNVGYRMYLNQTNASVAPFGRLSYYAANVGFIVRLH